MFSKFTDKILGLSSRYTFYKSEYERLESRCQLLEEENNFLRDDVKSLLSRQEELLNKYADNNDDQLLNAFLSFQEHFSNVEKDNKSSFDSLKDSCMRIEKSSSYTNIKLDTKFDENKHFIEENVINRLD